MLKFARALSHIKPLKLEWRKKFQVIALLRHFQNIIRPSVPSDCMSHTACHDVAICRIVHVRGKSCPRLYLLHMFEVNKSLLWVACKLHLPDNVSATFRTIDKHFKQVYFICVFYGKMLLKTSINVQCILRKTNQRPSQRYNTRSKLQNIESANLKSNPTNCRLKTNVVTQTPFKVVTPPTHLLKKITTPLKRCYHDFLTVYYTLQTL